MYPSGLWAEHAPPLTAVEINAEQKEYRMFLARFGKSILDEYRLPTGDDLEYWGTDYDTYFFKFPSATSKNKAPYWTNAFLNEDNKIDFAYILFRKADGAPFLIVFASQGNTYMPYIVSEAGGTMCVATDNFDVISDKIDIMPKPKHMLQFFHLEGHGNIIYWHPQKGDFVFFEPGDEK